MNGITVARVVVDNAVYHFDKPYDYLLPADYSYAAAGCRVLVPFGKGNSARQGLIIEICDDPPNCDKKLKSIISVMDETPIINTEMLLLAKWLKDKTFCTYFDAVRLILPTGISLRMVISYQLSDKDFSDIVSDDCQKQIIATLTRCASPVERDKLLKSVGLKSNCDILEKMAKKGILLRNDTATQKISDASLKMVRLLDYDTEQKFTSRQSTVIELLEQVGCGSVKELCYFTGVSQSVVDGLCKKGITEYYSQEIYRKVVSAKKAESNDIKLTDEQKAAYNSLSKSRADGYSVNLLYGITGSGKTQVFLKAADDVVADGKGVIVMVPEIALTPQTISTFSARYGDKIAVFHSAMSLGQRMDEWKRVKRGEALVAIGTRSAVFAPFSNLGLIIIDEEHEHTYKSEQSPKYHARDVAKFRAAYNKCPLILASATPSIESYCAAVNGRYNLLKLSTRYGTAQLPEVVTVDMRKELTDGNTSRISNFLQNSLDEVLNKNQQAILLLNRRGHNTFVSCASCGEVITCPNCSISMTYHSANRRLMCHYCGYSLPFADKCTVCGGEHLKYLGVGTQKIEDELHLMYPNARVLRMDADSTMRKDVYEKNLTAFANYEYDILLGTQMVAKGLNFPKVTLVGVLNADSAMFSDDFRAYEKTFSLLTQVVGRSGRGEEHGIAVIQTTHPDNEIISLAARQDYESFYNTEISVRKLMIYPPYCRIGMFVFGSLSRLDAEKAARAFFDMIVAKIDGEFPDVKINILGPSIANIPKVNNKYRYRIIVKFNSEQRFSQLLQSALNDFYASVYSKNTSISVDINPECIV